MGNRKFASEFSEKCEKWISRKFARYARFSKKMADSSQLVLSLILDQATKYNLNVRSTIGQETISNSESAVSAEL